MTCNPHRFEVFTDLHQCINCGMRLEDHQRIEQQQVQLTAARKDRDTFKRMFDEGERREAYKEKRIVELEAIKKALIAELPSVDHDKPNSK